MRAMPVGRCREKRVPTSWTLPRPTRTWRNTSDIRSHQTRCFFIRFSAIHHFEHESEEVCSIETGRSLAPTLLCLMTRTSHSLNNKTKYELRTSSVLEKYCSRGSSLMTAS